jgi:hypothetical protein
VSEFTSLIDLGWPPDDPPAISTNEAVRPARVMQQGSGAWHVHDGTREQVATARSRSLSPTPVTGDWVTISDDTGTCHVESVLPRRTTLSRAEAGGRSEEQVIAANVDIVGICSPSDAVNPRRLERELTAVWSSGAIPLVIVTKADLVDESGSIVASVESVCVGADVIAVSSQAGDGLDLVTSRLARGTTHPAWARARSSTRCAVTTCWPPGRCVGTARVGIRRPPGNSCRCPPGDCCSTPQECASSRRGWTTTASPARSPTSTLLRTSAGSPTAGMSASRGARC